MTPAQKGKLTNIRRAASTAKKQASKMYFNYSLCPPQKMVSANLDSWQHVLDDLLELERELK